MRTLTTYVFLILGLIANAQGNTPTSSTTSEKPKVEEKKWYEKMKWSGYAQMRYNRLLESNPNYKCESCDKSWGDNQSFFFRRARLTYQGYVNERVYAYVQMDYASIIKSKADQNENWNFIQLRDAYFDYGFDSKNEFRIRMGLTKVPYGFDNMQSSAVRLPMDRSDAMNSGAPNERDMGAFFLWSPENVRKLQRDTLTSNGMKGHGDYGVFMIGMYNGQSANKPELNDQVHVAAKLSYPIKIKSQIIEPGISAFAGRWVMGPDQLTSGVVTTSDKEYDDQRVAVGVMVQPRPIGLTAEYTKGKGPEFNPTTNTVETKNLEGAYATLSYRIASKKAGIIQPFFRAQYYNGGKKLEKDARHYHVNEWEGGVEWMVNKGMEVTASYQNGHRRMSDLSVLNYNESGHLLRLQVQFNY